MASVDHRSSAEIEREIEAERSALTRTLDEIQERLSFESLSGDFVERVRENSGDIGRAAVRSVKQNPVPLALTAIGLTWLIFNQRRDDDDPYRRVAATPASARYGVDDLREPGTARTPAPLYDASGRPLPHDDDEDGSSRWDRARGAVSSAARSMGSSFRSGRDSVGSGMGSARDRVSSGARAAGDAAQAGAGGFRDRVSRASRAARQRGSGAYASAAELRERITHGTENLSREARSRVIAARTRAYEAQLKAEHYAARGRERASDLFEDQPLVAGALALAVGAAIGGLLPRTNREDEAFGSYRDQVFEEAERIYREERAKLESVARETANEARDIARDVAQDVKGDLKEGAERTGEAARAKLSEAESTVKDAASDVADTAKSEAEKQKLGQKG